MRKVACFLAVAMGLSWGASDAALALEKFPISKTYKDVRAFMLQVAVEYPKTAKMFDLGMSDSGEMIQGLQIGDGSLHNLIVATHHGNEYGSTEVAKGAALALAAQPIEGQTVFVIPVLNISGYNDRQRNEMGKDPNRNYPGPCGTEGPFTLKSTAALAGFIDSQGIVTSATLHTFSPGVYYPWGISTHDVSTPYDDLYMKLGKAAAQESGYEVGNSTLLVYPADGAYEDYAYWKHGIWSLLFELGMSHTPSQDEVDQMVSVNVPGLRRFLEEAPKTRAEKHSFDGKCDTALRVLDRHEE